MRGLDRAGRSFGGALLAAGVAFFPAVALAHPHVAGDPFADVGDTLVAGSPRIEPIRSPSAERWRVAEVRGGEHVPAGAIEQRVTRADTPAGRQWCVAIEARDPAGMVTSRDSIWVSAGSPIPIYEWRATAGDTFSVRYDGRNVDLDGIRAGGRAPWKGAMTAAVFPQALDRLLLGRLKLAPGEAVALAILGIDREGGAREAALAVQSAGETLLDHRGRARRCDLFAATPDGAGADTRTVWIDRRTREVLREEIRNASGELLKVLEAE